MKLRGKRKSEQRGAKKIGSKRDFHRVFGKALFKGWKECELTLWVLKKFTGLTLRFILFLKTILILGLYTRTLNRNVIQLSMDFKISIFGEKAIGRVGEVGKKQ